jgi:hypothetical protein
LDAVLNRAIAAHLEKLAKKLITCRESFERDFWERVKDVKAAAAAGATSAAITHTEVLALARAIMDAEGNSYADVLYDSEELLAEVGYFGGKALLDLTTGFDVIPTATLQKLRDAAGAFESKINLQEKDALRLALTKAFEEGASVAETKTMLRLTFAEGYHSIGEDGTVTRRMPTDSWASAVARTELSSAANSGAFSLYEQAGVSQIEWVCSDSQNSCDICTEADGQVVNLGDTFDGVDCSSPPSHTNCQCTTSPADADLITSRGDETQQNWAARGGFDQAGFEEKFGFRHPMDDATDNE